MFEKKDTSLELNESMLGISELKTGTNMFEKKDTSLELDEEMLDISELKTVD